MKICYIDESGCTGGLPSATSDIQPLFAICGLIFDYSEMHGATQDLINLKKRYFPGRMSDPGRYMSGILDEIKGSTIRKSACKNGRNIRRQSLGYLGNNLKILENHDCKIVGRVWIKEPTAPCNGRAVYASSIQSISSKFQAYLEEHDDLGIVIADSRAKALNTQVAHSLFTQKHKGAGDAYDRIVELPTFAHSDNHAGLQLADMVISGLLVPIAVNTYCEGHITSVHVRPRYSEIKNKYTKRIQSLQYRYQEANGNWKGGLTVADPISKKSAREMFIL